MTNQCSRHPASPTSSRRTRRHATCPRRRPQAVRVTSVASDVHTLMRLARTAVYVVTLRGVGEIMYDAPRHLGLTGCLAAALRACVTLSAEGVVPGVEMWSETRLVGELELFGAELRLHAAGGGSRRVSAASLIAARR